MSSIILAGLGKAATGIYLFSALDLDIKDQTSWKRGWIGFGCIAEARRIGENACRPPRRPQADIRIDFSLIRR